MFENESKFRQNLKFFITAVSSEISDFEYVLINIKSNYQLNLVSQNDILDCYFVVFNDFSMFENESKF